jgi:hypothetical protein
MEKAWRWPAVQEGNNDKSVATRKELDGESKEKGG